MPSLYPPALDIVAVGFSAEGSKILTASAEKTDGVPWQNITTTPGSVITWDAKTGTKLAELSNRPAHVVFSPDGARIARRMSDTALEIVDIGAGKRLTEIAFPRDYRGSTFSFAPNSKQVFVAANSEIQLWDIDTKKQIKRFAAEVWLRDQSLRISPDGQRVAMVQWGAAQFWDVATGKKIRHATGHSGAVSGLAYSPDGRHLATAIEDTVLIFDARSGAELRRWIAHEKAIEQIAFSPDGKLLASASADGTIRLWDPATGKERRRLAARAAVKSIAFTRDGAALIGVGMDQNVQTWDVANGKPLQRHKIQAEGIRAYLCPTGDQLAYIIGDGSYGQRGAKDDVLHRMQARTGKTLPHVNLNRAPMVADPTVSTGFHGFAFSPDGMLMAACDDLFISRSRDSVPEYSIGVWEVVTQREIVRYSNNPNGTNLLAFSPDGRVLAHGGINGGVILRDVAADDNRAFPGWGRPFVPISEAERKSLGLINQHLGYITCLTFSPDGKYLATGGSDEVAYIWRVEHLLKRVALPEWKGDVAELWPHLADLNAGKAYRAMAQLARKPRETLALLRTHLHPAPIADEKAIAQHLRDLASVNFLVRHQAYQSLEAYGEQTAHLVRGAAKSPANLEVKRRIEILLDRLDNPLADVNKLRAYRCLNLLERMGSAEARQLLAELAEGAPAAWLTTEARDSLKRSRHGD